MKNQVQIKSLFFLICSLVISATTFAQVSGKVFQDFNANGSVDNSGNYKEVLAKGVLVKAYNNAGNLIGLYYTSSTPDAYGNNFSFPASGLNSIPAGTTVRLEFSNLGTSYPSSSAGGSTVQFVTAPASNVNLSVNYPKEYSQTNPVAVTNLFVEGIAPASPGQATVVSVPYSASGTSAVHTTEATHNQTGATWGLAWHRSSKVLFAAAYQKRHTSYGLGNSTGVIYKLPNPTDGSTAGVSVFLDLNTLFGSNVAGNNPHPNATANFATDESSYGLVGKIAFGGMDIAEDDKSIWLVNLADRQLYNIPLGTDPTNPVAPTLASQVTRYPLYNKCDCNGNGSLDAITDVDLRPFAVKAYRGKVYLGMVCSGQSTPNDFTKLKGYVFEFNPANGAFNQVLTFPLTYNRGNVNYGSTAWYVSPIPGGYTAGNTANWRPWDDVYSRSKLSCFESTFREGGYPQPMISDIAFDADGNMHLGLRDRFGDMVGDGLNEPGGSSTLLESDGVGDILRATPSGSGTWTMNMTEATNGTEFYANDNYSGNHDETSNGGLAILPGSSQIVYTVMDPVSNLSSGLDWANTTTGALDKSYEVHRRNSGTATTSNYFAKSNGNGDVELLSDAAPVEIGNRVWNDVNGNGMQDANEAGIQNVTLQLFADFNKDGVPDGASIASVNTNVKGEWYFNNTNVVDGDPVTAGNQVGLKLGAGYIVRIANSDWNANNGVGIADLSGLKLTLMDVSSTSGDVIDNDAVLVSGIPQINAIAGLAGQNNFDYDLGFTLISFLPIKFTSVTAEKINNTAAKIKWSVGNTETGVVYAVEKSTNGIDFSPIGTVNGTTDVQYSFTDFAPVTTTKNYYRIREVNTSGSAVYSEIRWVKFNSDIKMELYPVPAKNNVNLLITDVSAYKNLNASIYNIQGQKVKIQSVNAGTNKLDITALNSGVYQLVISNGDELLETRKLVIQ